VRAVTLSAMPESIREVVPGLFHWTARHPSIGIDVSSYFLSEDRVVLDPLEPPDGFGWFDGREPATVVLTTRHHLREAEAFADRFGAALRAPRPGLGDLPDRFEPYDYGEEIVGGIRAHKLIDAWPDDSALEIPQLRALAVADGVVEFGNGLQFVPDEYMGDDPEAEKEAFREAYAKLAEEVDFDHLLLAHGEPIVGDGREALRRFATSG
jgi:hypothetical protein